MTEWINVKTHLPPINTLVLCIGAKGGMFLGESSCVFLRDNETCYMNVPNSRGGRYATYWMPLPEKPIDTI